MKQWILMIVVLVALATSFYYLTLYYFPNYVYHRFQEKVMSAPGAEENTFRIIGAPDETSRQVVKPNPDFSYGSAFYNLKDGPHRITGDMPDSTYWSVALYQPNTINYYVKNDLQYMTDTLDVILTDHLLEGYEQEQIIATTEEGFILVRVLIADRTRDESRIVGHMESLAIHPLD